MKFHWKTETNTFNIKDRETGEDRKITTSRTYPEKFLGVYDVEGSDASTASETAAAPAQPQQSASSPSPATSSVTQPAPASNGAFDLSAHDPAMIAKLRVHAKSKSYNDFIDAALGVDGVTSNDDLIALLGEQSFYEQLKA